jgi:hypothetical protein
MAGQEHCSRVFEYLGEHRVRRGAQTVQPSLNDFWDFQYAITYTARIPLIYHVVRIKFAGQLFIILRHFHEYMNTNDKK